MLSAAESELKDKFSGRVAYKIQKMNKGSLFISPAFSRR